MLDIRRERQNIGDDIVVAGARLHVSTVPAPVHDDERQSGRRDERHHRRVGQSPAHVIDENRARVDVFILRDVDLRDIYDAAISGEFAVDAKFSPTLPTMPSMI